MPNNQLFEQSFIVLYSAASLESTYLDLKLFTSFYSFCGKHEKG